MKNKTIRKKITIIISIIAVVSMLSTMVYSFNMKSFLGSLGRVRDDIMTEKLRAEKSAASAEVYTQNGTVVGEIKLSNDVKAEDVSKLAEDYAQKLKEKYNDKEIDIKLSNSKDETLELIENFKSNSKPNATIIIQPGVLDFDRYVIVKLDTNSPQDYNVSSNNLEFKYKADQKIFQQIVPISDEKKIKESIIIQPKK